MIKCYFCGASSFVPPEYPAGSQMPCAKCGKEILVPFMLRHFEVRQIIASGGMGTVYRAYDTVLQREVAVKLMKPELAADPKKLDEFYREAKVIAALNHPHIIQVFHFGEFEGQNFIAMELADHGSLEDRIKQHGKVSEADALDAGIKVGTALGYALEKDLLHRDLKPANILFNAAGEPKLVDWGLATKTDAATEWGAGEIWGTPEYVAPEKVRREGETFHADMYSLGATIYQALTGKVPFECATVQETVNAHVQQPVKPPRQLVREISKATSEAIVRLLAKKPRERFATYDEMVETLAAARSGLLVASFEAGQTASGAAGSRKTSRLARATVGSGAPPGGAAGAGGKKGVLVAVAVVAVAAIGAGAYLLTREKGETVVQPPVDPATNVVAQTNPPPVTNVASTSPPAITPVPTIPRPQFTTPFVNLTDAQATNYWRGFVGSSRTFPASTWKFQGGMLAVISSNRTPMVIKEKYIDFEFSFEWKADAETRAALVFALNEGIENPTGNALRVPLGDDAGVQGGAKGRNAVGSFAGLFGPSTNKLLKPSGQFNHTRLVVLKDKVEIWLNYQKVNDVTLTSARFKNALEKNEQLKNRAYLGKTTSGFVGFQPSPGFAFRNARIRAIAEMPEPPRPPATFTMPAAPSKPAAKKKK